MEYMKVPQAINDVVGDNVQLLAQLFPAAVKDGLVDFEALREELGEFQEVDAEKYELTWSGKQAAKKLSQQDAVNRTLHFVPEDSKNANITENLYIEGDNLEVLKLLRQNYYGAIKLIYIDPPYNTGNDFVYNDKFAMTKIASDIAEGATDEEGNPLQKNTKSKNRFHAKWLDMLYARLSLARHLLRVDGLIFVSIDDNEVTNLKKICDEIFNEVNYIGCVARVAKTTSFRGNFLAPSKDYLLCYAKDITSLQNFSDNVDATQFKKIEKDGSRIGEYYRDDIAFYLSTLETRPNQRYFVECPDGERVLPPGTTMPPEKPVDGDGVWRWNLDSFNAKKELIVFKRTSRSPLITEHGEQAHWNLYTKSYLNDKLLNGNIPRDMWDGFLNRNSTEELKKMEIPFSFAKPVSLIKYILKIVQTESDDIILDFFSGSATTAHAVMQLNAEDGGNRKFIMVQYPEKTDEKSEAAKAGYPTICDIGKERIRRAGEKIFADNASKENVEQLDVGFKVFRTADTNIRWNLHDYQDGEQISTETLQSSPDLADFTDGFNDIDVVYEIMLRQKDIALSEPLEQLAEIGARTYLYASAYLVCLETTITPELIEKLASLDPLPVKFVFRDSAFGDDINLKDETFRRLKTLVERNTSNVKKTYTVEFI